MDLQNTVVPFKLEGWNKRRRNQGKNDADNRYGHGLGKSRPPPQKGLKSFVSFPLHPENPQFFGPQQNDGEKQKIGRQGRQKPDARYPAKFRKSLEIVDDQNKKTGTGGKHPHGGRPPRLDQAVHQRILLRQAGLAVLDVARKHVDSDVHSKAEQDGKKKGVNDIQLLDEQGTKGKTHQHTAHQRNKNENNAHNPSQINHQQ